jgi:hypothetical protein
MKTVRYEAGARERGFYLRRVRAHVLKEMHEAGSEKRERLFAGAIKRHIRGVE